MSQQIAVAVNGILGKMGREVATAVCQQEDMTVVGGADILADHDRMELPNSRGEVALDRDIGTLLSVIEPNVLVDFTIADSSLAAARIAAAKGVNIVIGTTGLSEENLNEINELAQQKGIGVIIAPNFTIGAVLMMHLAKIAAQHFDYAEIIEEHNQAKVDSPSGTSITTAHAMIKARGKPFLYPETRKAILKDSRGGQVDGVSIHSVRLPGFVANQEIIFGGLGQTLSIKHCTVNRECFMPGVLLAIRKVIGQRGLQYGLENLLNLGGV